MRCGGGAGLGRVIVLITFAFALIGGQPADSAATTRELTEIEARLATTYKAGDCDGWGALLAPEWSVIHITGAEITRAEAIRMCKAPAAPNRDLVERQSRRP